MKKFVKRLVVVCLCACMLTLSNSPFVQIAEAKVDGPQYGGSTTPAQVKNVYTQRIGGVGFGTDIMQLTFSPVSNADGYYIIIDTLKANKYWDQQVINTTKTTYGYEQNKLQYMEVYVASYRVINGVTYMSTGVKAKRK